MSVDREIVEAVGDLPMYEEVKEDVVLFLAYRHPETYAPEELYEEGVVRSYKHNGVVFAISGKDDLPELVQDAVEDVWAYQEQTPRNFLNTVEEAEDAVFFEPDEETEIRFGVDDQYLLTR